MPTEIPVVFVEPVVRVGPEACGSLVAFDVGRVQVFVVSSAPGVQGPFVLDLSMLMEVSVTYPLLAYPVV